jgi:ABC-type transport system involved in cytochrome c biogenesis permease subunit
MAEVAPARRNRIIAIVASIVTITAIVVAFAAEYFELPWKWLRPSAELLLLAELVGLVVLERHQLFEPVSEHVSGMQAHVAEMREAMMSANLPAMGATLTQLNERVGAAGQVTACNGAR